MKRDPVVYFNHPEHGFRRVDAVSAHLQSMFSLEFEAIGAEHPGPGKYGLLFGDVCNGDTDFRLHIEPVFTIAFQAFGMLPGIYERNFNMRILISLKRFLYIVVNLSIVAIKFFDFKCS